MASPPFSPENQVSTIEGILAATQSIQSGLPLQSTTTTGLPVPRTALINCICGSLRSRLARSFPSPTILRSSPRTTMATSEFLARSPARVSRSPEADEPLTEEEVSVAGGAVGEVAGEAVADAYPFSKRMD